MYSQWGIYILMLLLISMPIVSVHKLEDSFYMHTLQHLAGSSHCSISPTSHLALVQLGSELFVGLIVFFLFWFLNLAELDELD